MGPHLKDIMGFVPSINNYKKLEGSPRLGGSSVVNGAERTNTHQAGGHRVGSIGAQPT